MIREIVNRILARHHAHAMSVPYRYGGQVPCHCADCQDLKDILAILGGAATTPVPAGRGEAP